jgi:hypothetical protein
MAAEIIPHFPGCLDGIFIGRHGNKRLQAARHGFHIQRSCHCLRKRTPADISLADEHETLDRCPVYSAVVAIPAEEILDSMPAGTYEPGM